jgi:hypothetical protein
VLTPEHRGILENCLDMIEEVALSIPDAKGNALIVLAGRARAIINADKHAAASLTRWQRLVRWLCERQKPVIDLGLRRCGCGGVYEGPDVGGSCPTCQAHDRTAAYLARRRHHDT